MINRKLDKNHFTGSNFLLGPRKVGKSSFLQTNFADSLYIDLLDNSLFAEYVNDPGSMYAFIRHAIDREPSLRNCPIIIDEIQRLPLLLNDVHRLIESEKLNFILCGSSARKLVRGGANMLGGRAGRISMGGLSIAEIENFQLLRFLNHGGIPAHYIAEQARDDISAYVQNYLNEEIKGEALVRNVRSFDRFLDLVGITNGEEVNYTSIARDVGVDAKTIREYFQILLDTLVGSYLEPYFDRQKRTNILKSPKFYLFDTGVANFLRGISLTKDEGFEFGKSLEHVVYNELQNYKNYANADLKISFWRTYEQDEVDFILQDAQVAIEVKASKNVANINFKSLLKFKDEYQPQQTLVVANVNSPQKLDNGVEILPLIEFIRLLWSGQIV